MNRYKKEQKRRREDPDLDPLPEGSTVSQEEFIEMLNRRDSWARHKRREAKRLRKQKQPPHVSFFHEDKPDWRNDDLYLMNTGDTPIESITYSLRVYDHPNLVGDFLVYAATDLPPNGYVKVRDEDGETIPFRAVTTHSVTWAGGETWTGDAAAVEITNWRFRPHDDPEPVEVERIPELVCTVPPESPDASHLTLNAE